MSDREKALTEQAQGWQSRAAVLLCCRDEQGWTTPTARLAWEHAVAQAAACYTLLSR